MKVCSLRVAVSFFAKSLTTSLAIGTRTLAASVLIASISVATGCTTDADVTKNDKNPTARATTSIEVDPHALCKIHLEVENARYVGTLAQVHEGMLKDRNKPGSAGRAATFGALLSLSTAKKSWTGFRDENIENSGTVLFPLGECLVYAGWKMDDQAPPRCAAAKAKLSGLALADVGLAHLWLSRGKLDKATVAADRALATDSKCASAHVVKALVANKQGNDDAAIAQFEQALADQPSCFLCAAEAATLVEKKGDLAAAALAWEKALAITPDHAPSLERYAAVQVGNDDGKALAAYEQAIAGGHPSYSTLLAAAQLADRTGATLKAIDYAEKASRIEPDHVSQWRLLARLYVKRNETEATEKAYEEVLRLLPDDRQAHLELARLADKEERFVEAIAHYLVVSQAVLDAEPPVPADEAAAVASEQAALYQKLHVKAPVQGSPEIIQDRVRRTVQELFKARHKPGTKGKIVVTVKTFKSGEVEEANILEDTLKDPYVTASLLGNLQIAKISGGRKLYEFEYGFQ